MGEAVRKGCLFYFAASNLTVFAGRSAPTERSFCFGNPRYARVPFAALGASASLHLLASSGASSLRFCFVAGSPPQGAEPSLCLSLLLSASLLVLATPGLAGSRLRAKSLRPFGTCLFTGRGAVASSFALPGLAPSPLVSTRSYPSPGFINNVSTTLLLRFMGTK